MHTINTKFFERLLCAHRHIIEKPIKQWYTTNLANCSEFVFGVKQPKSKETFGATGKWKCERHFN